MISWKREKLIFFCYFFHFRLNMAKDLLNFVNILQELPCTVPNRNLLSLLRDESCIKNEAEGLKQWTTLLNFNNKFDLLLDEMLLIDLTKNCGDADKRMEHLFQEKAALYTENLLNTLLACLWNFRSIYFRIDGFSSLVCKIILHWYRVATQIMTLLINAFKLQ